MKKIVLIIALSCFILQSPAGAFRLFGERRAPALATALRWTSERFQAPRQRAEQYNAQIKRQYGERHSGLVTDRIMSRITSGIPNYNRYPWVAHVLVDKQVNAFCTGGTHIYLFEGLITKSPSEDALAFVIGHEIGHTIAGHIDRQAEVNARNNLIGAVLGKNATVDLGRLINLGSNYMYGMFSRDHEREADVLGTWYMYKAGYDPVGGIDFFNKLYELHGDSSGLDKLFGSHPTLKERMARIRQVVGWLKGEVKWDNLGQEVQYILQALQDFPGEKPR